MSEERHVASLVATHGLPEDMDLVIQTLEQSEFIRIHRVNGNYADITVKIEEVEA